MRPTLLSVCRAILLQKITYEYEYGPPWPMPARSARTARKSRGASSDFFCAFCLFASVAVGHPVGFAELRGLPGGTASGHRVLPRFVLLMRGVCKFLGAQQGSTWRVGISHHCFSIRLDRFVAKHIAPRHLDVGSCGERLVDQGIFAKY